MNIQLVSGPTNNSYTMNFLAQKMILLPTLIFLSGSNCVEISSENDHSDSGAVSLKISKTDDLTEIHYDATDIKLASGRDAEARPFKRSSQVRKVFKLPKIISIVRSQF